jgi:hypothetical protein
VRLCRRLEVRECRDVVDGLVRAMSPGEGDMIGHPRVVVRWKAGEVPASGWEWTRGHLDVDLVIVSS